MAITIKHAKTDTIADWTQADLDAQIALGNYPPGTLLADIVLPSDWNSDHTFTGTLGVANGGTGATTLTGYVKGNGTSAFTATTTIPNTDITGLGTMATQNASSVAITGGTISGATVSGYIPTTEKGVANGVATLDAGGKVPVSQIPALGDLNYQGTWNASTNTPTLTSSVGTKGYYYVVNVAGTTNLNGITDWQVGDWAVYNGSAWQKIDNTDAVTSVNGYTGTVVLTYADVGAANAPVNTNITSMTGITGGISTADYVTFDTTYATALTTGQLGWDSTNNALAYGMANGNIIQHIGEDQYLYIKASSAITKGQVCMFTGSVGASGVLTAAPATGITDGSYIMGVAAESIATNGFGFVQTFGVITNVNTTGFADGDILWYNPSVTGGLTNTKPSAPNVKVQVAACNKGGSAGGGVITVRVNPGSQLGGTDSNAQITAPVNGQILTYDGTNAYWKNTTLIAGTGITTTPSATGVITVTNTAPDQTVAITGTSPVSVTGTYPNFTVSMTQASTSTNGWLSSTDWNTFNNKGSGTVTSVTAVAPVVSSGGTTPIISMAAANATTNGYLTSTDWSIFNSKQTAYTNLTTFGSLANATGWLYNNGTGTLSYSTPTAAQVGAVPTTRSLTINGTAYDLSADRTWSVGTVTSVAALTLGTTGTDLSSTVATGTTTPVITLNVPTASATNRGALSSADWTTFNGKMTNPMTTLGDVIYGGASGASTRLAGNTTTAKQFLSQTGTGTASAAPAWSALPTVLPVLNRAGSTVSVSVGNGVLPVLNRAGSTVNVAIN